jgi:histidinol-phosphate/aromatic aminotransferase/cobyric acid decarboxylase-like protein
MVKAERPEPRPGVMDIAAYVPGKSSAHGVSKVYKLSSNENPLGASPAAIEAVRWAAEHLELYPDGSATKLREAIAEVHGLNPANILCSNGSDELLENSARIARLLLEKGVNVDATDEHGYTPLMMAANRNNLPLVKLLLSAGADVNRQQSDELNQLSVLMFAPHPEMVRFLLEHGADPTIRTAYGKNAYEVQLMNSHQKHYKEMAEMIQGYLK